MKPSKLLSLFGTVLIGSTAIGSLSLLSTSCGNGGGGQENPTDYTVVAHCEDDNRTWYISDDVKGQISGKWIVALNKAGDGYEIANYPAYPFVGHDVYVPKWLDVNHVRYPVLRFQGGGSLSGVITLPDGLITIGNYAFGEENNPDITSVIIPNSVTTILSQAFFECRWLTSISLPNGVNSIGASAFYSCSNLTSFTFPSSLTTISAGLFYDCSSLETIIIPDTIDAIEVMAFADCISLTSIELSSNILYLGTGVFWGCENLSSVILSENIPVIPDSTFYNCYSLEDVTLPDNITIIGLEAFSGCSSLTSISIPDTVEYIDDDAFSNCESLTDIYLTGDFLEYNDYLSNTQFTDGDREGVNIHVPSSLLDTYTEDGDWIDAIGEDYIDSVFVAII